MYRHSVSRVIFAVDHSQLNRVEEAIGACEVEGVPAWLMTDFIHTSTSKPDFDAFAGRPMLVFRSTPEVSWALLLKGIIDRVRFRRISDHGHSHGDHRVGHPNHLAGADHFSSASCREIWKTVRDA